MARLALICSLLIIFIAPAAFAYDGLSIGLGLGVSTDIGDFKTTEIAAIKGMENSDLDSDSNAVTPNITLYLRLDFGKLYFIRAGVEYSEMVVGNDLEGHNTNGNVDISYDYRSTAIPVFFGINIPVKRGRYNFFTGIGPAFVKINFEKEYEFTILPATPKYIRGRMEGDIDGPGTAFIAGASINLTRNLHFSIEFQKLYFSQYVTIEGHQEIEQPPGTPQPGEEVHDIMRLSAPDDTIRFGLVYDI